MTSIARQTPLRGRAQAPKRVWGGVVPCQSTTVALQETGVHTWHAQQPTAPLH